MDVEQGIFDYIMLKYMGVVKFKGNSWNIKIGSGFMKSMVIWQVVKDNFWIL